MSLLTLEALSVHRGACPVVDGASLSVGPGEFVGLIGPNGAGKTTLLRAALGLLPHTGHSSLAVLPPVARARAAAFLPQGREVAWPLPVAALVALGRAPWGPGPGDGPAVDRALDRLGLAGFRDRDATALSGGELARVLLARVLAQETPLILADEPVAGLDPEAQLRVMGLFAGLAGEGRGIVASIHDLGLAMRFCTRLVLLSAGRVVADGAPAAVLSDANLAAAFGIRAFRAETADGPVLQPLSVLR
jgi:iron complex transport system ATP-binding protein